MASLRKFRHSISVLKKQGLVSKTVDARSAKPSDKSTGKKLQTIVDGFDDVISGKLTALKVKPSKLKQFRKAGYETAKGRVLVPHGSTEKAKLVKGEVNIISTEKGLVRIQIPVEFHNLKQYLTDIARNKKRINQMKRDNEYFGFRFFGNNSTALYSNVEAAIADLRKYETVLAAHSRYKQKEVYRNIEIIRVVREKDWVFPSERKRQMSKAYARMKQKQFREKLKHKSSVKREMYAEAHRERQRKYRARLKRDKKRYNTELKASRTRSAKYRKTHKKKAKKKSKRK